VPRPRFSGEQFINYSGASRRETTDLCLDDAMARDRREAFAQGERLRRGNLPSFRDGL